MKALNARMCIAVIVVNYSPRFPLIITHNREEDPLRPTSDLGLWNHILSAVDLKAGGVAAVGLNVSSGQFAVLTNCRYHKSSRPGGVSRGSIVREIISNGVGDSIRDWIARTKFQGDFHLHCGNAFVDSKVEIEYFTNIDDLECEKSEYSVTPSAPLEVIVCMNQHPKSLSDWENKLTWVKSHVQSALSVNRDLNSISEVSDLIENIISKIDPISTNPGSGSYEWSPIPASESFIQAHIVFPNIEVSPGVLFGTVSQTIIIVDRDSRQIVYKYRRVEGSTQNKVVDFLPWQHKLVNY